LSIKAFLASDVPSSLSCECRPNSLVFALFWTLAETNADLFGLAQIAQDFPQGKFTRCAESLHGIDNSGSIGVSSDRDLYCRTACKLKFCGFLPAFRNELAGTADAQLEPNSEKETVAEAHNTRRNA
jgi:hypothetical protein